MKLVHCEICGVLIAEGRDWDAAIYLAEIRGGRFGHNGVFTCFYCRINGRTADKPLNNLNDND